MYLLFILCVNIFVARYMKRRCAFLDKCPAFNYNTGHGEYYEDAAGKKMTSDTRKLGSTLISTMLREVADLCDPKIKGNWSLKPHQQVIVNYSMGKHYNTHLYFTLS